MSRVLTVGGKEMLKKDSRIITIQGRGQNDIESTGDMEKLIYDPSNINANVYDRTNHTGEQPESSITDLLSHLLGKEAKENKNQMGGYVGISADGYIVFKDSGGDGVSALIGHQNTLPRVYTFPDESGVVVLSPQLALKENIKTRGTGTVSANAVTLNKDICVITVSNIILAGASYTFTLTNNIIATSSGVLYGISNGTNTTGLPVIQSVTVGSGTASVKILNTGGQSLVGDTNGTLILTIQIV